MNMQQLMFQAQKMKRDLDKAKKELSEKEFEVSKGGAVKVTLKGDRTIKSINIDNGAFDQDNKDMIEDMIVMAINEAMQQIQDAEDQLNQKVTGNAGGLGF